MARRKPTFNYIQKYLWPPTCGFSIKQRSVQCCLSCKRLLFCSVKRGPGTFVATLNENVYSTISHLQKKVTKGACNQRNDDCNSNWNDGHGHRDECLSEHNSSREEKIHCRPRILTTPDHSLEVSVLAQKNSYVVKGTEVFLCLFHVIRRGGVFPGRLVVLRCTERLLPYNKSLMSCGLSAARGREEARSWCVSSGCTLFGGVWDLSCECRASKLHKHTDWRWW